MTPPLRLSGTGGRWPVVLLWVGSLLISLVVETGPVLSQPLRYLIDGVFWALVGLSFAAFLAAWIRWLHAVGRTGWWALTGLLPIIGSLLILASLFLRRRIVDPDRFAPAARYRYGAAVLVLLIVLGASRAVWHPYYIVSGSILPALAAGDYIIVSPIGAPSPGDVIVFRHPVDGTDFVFRLVATEGQTVKMAGGVLQIDGTPVRLEPGRVFEQVKTQLGPLGLVPRCANDLVPLGGVCLKDRATETLANGASHGVLNIQDDGVLDETPDYTVPAGHVFVLGDNRDNARDSRVPRSVGGPGFVPVEAIRGRWVGTVPNTSTLARWLTAAP